MLALSTAQDPDYTGPVVDSCGTCAAEIPADSTFCPMCGDKRDAHDPDVTEPRAAIPTPQPMPPAMTPEGSAPGAPVPNPAAFVPAATGNYSEISSPASGSQPRKTIPLTIQGAEALGAFDVAPRTQPSGPPKQPVGVYRVPGTPARIPIQPRPARIILGLVMIALGLWAILAYLPGREGDIDDALYIAGVGGSITLIVFGAFATLAGALYRAQVETICRKCDVQVIGWKRAFGLHCPMGGHYAKLNWFTVILTAVFWTSTLAIGAGMTYLVFS